MHRQSTALAALAFFAGSGFALADEASITVSPQPAGNSVIIDMVNAPVDGWLVIHQIKDGKPVVPGSIGHTAVKAGENAKVQVKLSMTPKAGGKLLAMLHHDTGKIGAYEFGPGAVAEDKPVVVDGKPVVKPFPVN